MWCNKENRRALPGMPYTEFHLPDVDPLVREVVKPERQVSGDSSGKRPVIGQLRTPGRPANTRSAKDEHGGWRYPKALYNDRGLLMLSTALVALEA